SGTSTSADCALSSYAGIWRHDAARDSALSRPFLVNLHGKAEWNPKLHTLPPALAGFAQLQHSGQILEPADDSITADAPQFGIELRRVVLFKLDQLRGPNVRHWRPHFIFLLDLGRLSAPLHPGRLLLETGSFRDIVIH